MIETNPSSDIGHHIVMLGRIIGAIDDKNSGALSSLIDGQDAILQCLRVLRV
jgi:hypothetical protein